MSEPTTATRNIGDALNALLEDERASVEAIVKLVSMATDGLERQALTKMGGQAVQACCDLHSRLDQVNVPVTGRVGPIDRVLAHERLEDRLYAFGRLQERLSNRIESLLLSGADPETATLLANLRAVALAHGAWAVRRAEEFAASRQIDTEPPSPTREALSAAPSGAERTDSPLLGAPSGTTDDAPDGNATIAAADVSTESEPADSMTQDGRPTSPRGRMRRSRWPSADPEPGDGEPS